MMINLSLSTSGCCAKIWGADGGLLAV